MRVIFTYLLYIIALTSIWGLSSCSLKENTARTRFIHSFTTRYNIYYNGKVAYDRGMMAKIEGHSDDYTERLPVFLVANEASQTLGAGDFSLAIVKSEKAIKLHSITRKPSINSSKKRSEKQKAFLKQKEYNPFLYNAWFLMGKSHFESGKFSEAASVFSYMMRLYATEPIIYQGAAAWLARCYAQLGWLYDAEDITTKLRRDSLYRPVRTVYNATMADLCLRQDSLAKALPYLEATARQSHNSYQRARLYYLLGQVYYALYRHEEAYKALTKCVRLNPPYSLAFNARILQAEVMGVRQSKQMLAKLKRMASSKNNENYLDQVYYAIGNIYLARHDTIAAMNAYEEGERKAKRNDIHKGVLLLRLGELYWEQQKFSGAQRCYSQVVGLLNKTHRKYEEANVRSAVLDELVPHINVITTQDSLIALAQMPEIERMKVIEQAIATYKKQEKEKERQQRDSLRRLQIEANGGNIDEAEELSSPSTPSINVATTGEWYFYNPMLVAKGKNEFKKRWGNRSNEDDWRRLNKTALLSDRVQQADSISSELSIDEPEDSQNIGEEKELLPTEDPKQVDYYLAQIPLTEEQMQAAKAQIAEALWKAGQIEQEKINDLSLAESTYMRLYHHYPSFTQREALYYQLFLLYQRMGDTSKATNYREQIVAEFPEGKLARLLSHPNYERMVREGEYLEDALYTQAYQDFKAGQYDAVGMAIEQSLVDYPEGAHRAKFVLLDALIQLQQKATNKAIATLTTLLQEYPQSDVVSMATTLLEGLKAGRSLESGSFDFNTLWTRRSQALEVSSDSIAKDERVLSTQYDAPFLCVIAFMPDSIEREQLLYQVSRFNFSHFLVRNFNAQFVLDEGLQQLRITGFTSYGEVRAYASQLLAQPELLPFLSRVKVILISENNLQKIGVTHSFADYAVFHDKVFTPLRINLRQNLDANVTELEHHYEDNLPPELSPLLKEQVIPDMPQSSTPTTSKEEEQEANDEVWYDLD